MSIENVDATPERGSDPPDLSPRAGCRPEAEFRELVWENGQIMMQGQSSKARKGPYTNNYASFVHDSQGSEDLNGLRTNKFSAMDSVLNEMGLGQDVDMEPWLSYPVEDHLDDNYTCDFSPDLSGITLTDISTDNHLPLRERKSGYHGEASKVSSDTTTHDIPRSGVSGITSEIVENTQNISSSQGFNSSSLCAFTNLRLQKLDAGNPSRSSSFTNFPYFSRSTVLAKANQLTVNASKRSEKDEQRCTISSSVPTDTTVVNLASPCSRREIGTCNQSVQDSVDEISGSLPRKLAEEIVLTKRTLTEDGCQNDAQQNYASDATRNKFGMGGAKNMEPIVAASSVCSGNSVDKASNERGNDLKGKSHETTESEGPSDEFEDKSVGAKKAANARASSKRSRAAEVHNLSERKRRDRINEKMRALQELIPNCNKVDKASMLDEAIEYLKTLQLQVQMLSMGAGLYMQPNMLPPGMQPIHGALMPHFSSMALGMSMGVGFGMNMLDKNSYPLPGTSAPSHGMPGPSAPPFGFPGQGVQMSMQQVLSQPIPGAPPLNTSIGLNVPGVAGTGVSNLAPSTTAKDSAGQIPNNSVNQATNQATKEVIQQSSSSHDRRQNTDASESSLPASKANDAA